MGSVAVAAATVLLLTLGAVLVRLERGPTGADRVLAATFIGTTGVAVLLLLSRATGRPALLDVALVLAVLAAVPVIVHVTRVAGGR
jgi:multicomponent Na+:H+ antiporter subunit F